MACVRENTTPPKRAETRKPALKLFQLKLLRQAKLPLGNTMSNLAGCVVSSDVNTAQFTDCLLGGPCGGYFADSKSAWAFTISNFNPTDDWTRVFLKSDKVIPVLYSNLPTVKSVSEATNNPVPYAIAEIIKVAAMSRVTDTYGPIPYSKIGADGKKPFLTILKRKFIISFLRS